MIRYDRARFYASLRDQKVHTALNQKQIEGYEFILSYAEKVQDPLKFLAYRLATAKWETASTLQPIEEYGRGAGRKYGPTGFWGRGYVQLTWDYNYAKATMKLHELGLIPDDVSFTQDPDLVMKPEYAVVILFVGMNEGWFTGKKLSDYFSGTEADPLGARRIINGTDKASEIAALYRKFITALLVAEIKEDGTPVLILEDPVVVDGLSKIKLALTALIPLSTTNKTRIEKAIVALS